MMSYKTDMLHNVNKLSILIYTLVKGATQQNTEVKKNVKNLSVLKYVCTKDMKVTS